MSVRQTSVWHDSVTLFEHMIETLADDPYRYDIYWRLGLFHLKEDRLSEAEVALEQAVAIAPGHARSHDLLGSALFLQGKYERATAEYGAAVQLTPGSISARYKYADSLVKLGKLDEAINQLQVALNIAPQATHARDFLGSLLACKQGTGPCPQGGG